MSMTTDQANQLRRDEVIKFRKATAKRLGLIASMHEVHKDLMRSNGDYAKHWYSLKHKPLWYYQG